MTAPSVPSVYSRWSRWLGSLTIEVLDLFTDRHVWQETRRIIDEHGALPSSYFWDWMAGGYVRSSALAVRRLSESNYWTDREGRRRVKGKPVISLVGLLEDMELNNRALTRSRFTRRYPGHMRDHGLADRDFDRIAGAGRAFVSKRRLQSELSALRRAARPIQTYVNRHVAHYDKKPMRRLPTYKDLDYAIEEIGRVFQRCELTIRSSQHSELVPTFTYDWTKVFREPWIQRDGSGGGQRSP